MKAALCKSLDGPDAIVIEDIAEPLPGEDQVIVRVKAAALNFFDTLQTRGKYQFKPPLPFSPAGEFAGVIDKVGAGVSGFKPGDRVFGYGHEGAAREKIAVPAAGLIRTPEGVADEIACGITVTYGTALHGLKDRAGLQSGETCAVLGASGGAGLAAVELAKIMGATVIACASSDDKLNVCKSRGADTLVNYSDGDLKEKLRAATGGKGVDVIYDCVGDRFAEPAVRAMNWGGRYLVIGFAGGDIPRIPLNLLLLKSCALIGVFWGAHVARNPSSHEANMSELADWVRSGRLRPHIHKVYELVETAEAIRELDRRASTGKVVIRIA